MLQCAVLLAGLVATQAAPPHCRADLLDLLAGGVRDCLARQTRVLTAASLQFPGPAMQLYREQVTSALQPTCQLSEVGVEAVCLTLRRTVRNCGSLWRSCYSPLEVEQLQKLLLSSLLQQRPAVKWLL